ncbi:MAG: Rpn family recombination-promoting nuclease/putative transposase [Catalinimonas sp.]
MEQRYVSMLSDYGFKVTFGNEHRTDFLRRALQALIAAEAPIERVTFGRNEVSGLTPEGRGGRFDVVCEDERGRTFIVEMQLTAYPQFIQRAKFYAFHKFNTLVQRGRYQFDALTPIYTVSLLAETTFPGDRYHQIVTLRNQHGEMVDDQITHVLVELSKFRKALPEIDTDLDKLLYTMKTTHKQPEAPLPDFMKEGWIAEALETLKTARLTPEERMYLEMDVAGAVTRRLAEQAALRREVEGEVREHVTQEIREHVTQEVSKRVTQEVSKRVTQEVREESIVRMLRAGVLTDAQIAEFSGASVDEVEAVRIRLTDGGAAR